MPSSSNSSASDSESISSISSVSDESSVSQSESSVSQSESSMSESESSMSESESSMSESESSMSESESSMSESESSMSESESSVSGSESSVSGSESSVSGSESSVSESESSVSESESSVSESESSVSESESSETGGDESSSDDLSSELSSQSDQSDVSSQSGGFSESSELSDQTEESGDSSPSSQSSESSSSSVMCPWEERHGGLMITIIAVNANWPGNRPAGLEDRLGYAAGANPNDDQILFDVILHIPGGLVDELNKALGSPIEVPVGGDLTHATLGDKQWLALAFLKRSTNAVPPPNIPFAGLSDIVKLGDWRLINEFVICPEVAAGQFSADVPIYRKKSLIGPTPLTNLASVTFKVRIGGTVFTVTLEPNALSLKLSLNTADAADENDKLVGGKAGDTSFMHRTAGRIGPSLEPYERALIPKRAPPFFCEITFVVNPDDSIRMENKPSWDPDEPCIWPSAYVYQLNRANQNYQLQNPGGIWHQGETPFVCFVGHGTDWPV
jgi:hypothetical protein